MDLNPPSITQTSIIKNKINPAEKSAALSGVML
jgi:hypothetical protein